jgi:hypothetical protein
VVLRQRRDPEGKVLPRQSRGHAAFPRGRTIAAGQGSAGAGAGQRTDGGKGQEEGEGNNENSAVHFSSGRGFVSQTNPLLPFIVQVLTPLKKKPENGFFLVL